MLIAQALGEYAALSAVIDAFSYGTSRLEEFAGGQWATEALLAVVAVGVIWKIITLAR
jgi:hypothetical protein